MTVSDPENEVMKICMVPLLNVSPMLLSNTHLWLEALSNKLSEVAVTPIIRNIISVA